MVTIKSYTDLEQSKKLAKILPIESADMCFEYQKDRWVSEPDYKEFPQLEHATDKRDIPCWSLAALLGVLPEKYTELIKEGGMYRIIIKDSYMTCLFDNPVDACCELIVKLHELKVL